MAPPVLYVLVTLNNSKIDMDSVEVTVSGAGCWAHPTDLEPTTKG